MLLEQLIDDKKIRPRVMLRQKIYLDSELDLLLQEILAVANTLEAGPRYILFGVSRDDGDKVVYSEPERGAIARLKILADYVSKRIEPDLQIKPEFGHLNGALGAALEIDGCNDQPYLLREDVNDELRRGDFWVLDGTAVRKGERNDLARLFQRSAAGIAISNGAQNGGLNGSGNGHASEDAAAPALPLHVGLNGDPEQFEQVFDLPDVSRPPSAVAAARIKKTIAAKKQAAKQGGTEDTSVLRLMHARLYGNDTPYEAKGVNTLIEGYNSVEADYREEDNYYYFSEKAVPLNLSIRNNEDDAVENVSLVVDIPLLEQCRVADRLYNKESGGISIMESQLQGYPKVEFLQDSVRIRQEIPALEPGESIEAFELPIQLAVDPTLSGKKIAIRYVLQSDNLGGPVSDRLKIGFR